MFRSDSSAYNHADFILWYYRVTIQIFDSGNILRQGLERDAEFIPWTVISTATGEGTRSSWENRAVRKIRLLSVFTTAHGISCYSIFSESNFYREDSVIKRNALPNPQLPIPESSFPTVIIRGIVSFCIHLIHRSCSCWQTGILCAWTVRRIIFVITSPCTIDWSRLLKYDFWE